MDKLILNWRAVLTLVSLVAFVLVGGAPDDGGW